MSFNARLQQKEAFIVFDVLRVDVVEITLAEGEVVDGVEHRGFSRTVIANEAIGSWTKIQLRIGVVLKIDD